jgi:hypothetical protein
VTARERHAAPAVVRQLPPRVIASLRELGVDLTDPAMAAAFAEGVRVADEFGAELDLDRPCDGPRRRRAAGL